MSVRIYDRFVNVSRGEDQKRRQMLLRLPYGAISGCTNNNQTTVQYVVSSIPALTQCWLLVLEYYKWT
jgi:hypothetical protein